MTDTQKMAQQRDESPRGKPLLSAGEQIDRLRSKGVTFELCSEEEAADYLAHANNYLRAASYRKLFPVHAEGPREGLFVNLDFAYLVELSSIDRMLREALLCIAIDVEHFAKIRLLERLEVEGEDGYAAVRDFLAARPRVAGGLRSRAEAGERHDTYSGDLIAHHLGDMPVWVMLEVVDFGAFVDFWLFCAERWSDEGMRQRHYVLKSVKALRNATAHNSLVVHGLDAQDAPADFPTNALISASLNEHGVRNSRTRRAKLRNLRVAQIAATLWSLDEFCARPSTLARDAARLEAVRARVQGAAFARGASAGANVAIVSFFDFIWKLVDIWAPYRAK